MADIFISYKREEIAWAALVARALSEEGFTAFYDLDDEGIHAGEEWDKRLELELDAAKCCVVLWSRASIDSSNVRSEARRANARNILVPAKINECRAPLGLDTLQEADLSHWRGDRADAQWRFLVDRGTARKVGRAGCPPQAVPKPAPHPPRRTPELAKSRPFSSITTRRVALIGAGMTVLGAGAWLATQAGSAPPVGPVVPSGSDRGTTHPSAVPATPTRSGGSGRVRAAAETWTAATRHTSRHILQVGSAVFDAAWSPDGGRIITGSQDKTAQVWDAQTGEVLLTLAGHAGSIASATFSPDGARIATGSADNTARVWDARSGLSRLTLEGHTKRVGQAAFSLDGTRIVTASDDQTSCVWDATTGKRQVLIKEKAEYVWGAVFSPDGTRVVTATASWHVGKNTASVWDARTGDPLVTFSGHRLPVLSVAVSPDGSRILTASVDNTVRIWDASGGEALAALTGHEGWVNSAAFSPDGARIVTGSDDRTARVWDANTGQALLTLSGHGDRVSSAAFSPESARIVTASEDGAARVWVAE